MTGASGRASAFSFIATSASALRQSALDSGPETMCRTPPTDHKPSAPSPTDPTRTTYTVVQIYTHRGRYVELSIVPHGGSSRPSGIGHVNVPLTSCAHVPGARPSALEPGARALAALDLTAQHPSAHLPRLELSRFCGYVIFSTKRCPRLKATPCSWITSRALCIAAVMMSWMR